MYIIIAIKPNNDKMICYLLKRRTKGVIIVAAGGRQILILFCVLSFCGSPENAVPVPVPVPVGGVACCYLLHDIYQSDIYGGIVVGTAGVD